MNPRELRFTVTIDSNGVHSVPRMKYLESQLQLLAQGFPQDETPWKLVVDSDGKVLERVGFDSERLTIGQMVGSAVRDFVRALDPNLFNLVDQLVSAFALKMPEHYLNIDWDKAQFRFETLRALEASPFSMMILVGPYMVMPLPGAERGPYRDDVNAYIKAYFLEQLEAKIKAEIPHEAILIAQSLAELMARAKKFGFTLPDMNLLATQIGDHDAKMKAVPQHERTHALAEQLASEFKQIAASAFGSQFPEFALPPAAEPASPELSDDLGGTPTNGAKPAVPAPAAIA